ncbi:MAG TPA: radical SAM protein [Myxococcales bacterium]|nr:radical SAM protein [Myxococcales bacterium]
MKKLRLVQLPVPPPAALAATGNVPLAAGCLAVSGRGLGAEIEVVAPDVTDSLGDTQLADFVARDEPEFLGLSLYLWNCERSLHLAREVKRRSPKTRVLVGGPEVSADNPFVLQQSGFDIAVSGEAEDTFALLLQKLVKGDDVRGVPGVATRGPLGLSAFAPQPSANFELSKYPSPYLEDLVPVERQRSTYIETVRGCRSHCTFCFYPRSSSVLRTLDVPASARLVGALRDKGAREVVFLDPTFNHRPQFDELLDALVRENAAKELTFFAEVRAEGLTPEHARKLKQAGFDRLEIGLQSVNRETLKRVRRGGSPEKVAEAAKMLHGEGIELLVDLIVGLPGDEPDDVLRGIDFLEQHGLASEAQVFPLSLLPGTAMRATALEDGVVFDPAPPYRVQRTPTFSQEQLRETLTEAESRLNRRLDEWPRPHLCEGGLDGFAPQLAGPQHAALWFAGRDLFARRAEVLQAIDARLSIDPFATLDVVLAPADPFPLDLLEAIRAKLDAGPQSYASRSLAHRGENAQRRIAVVLRYAFDPDWIEAIRDLAQVFRDQPAHAALRDAARLGADLPGARIIGEVSQEAFAELARLADPDLVCFADRELEARWQQKVLGFGDARQVSPRALAGRA